MNDMKKMTIGLILMILAGCRTSDEEIRADIASKAQKDLNFAGLQYTVDHGQVAFTGICPSENALEKVKQAIDNIHVTKGVTYQVTIAPVVLNALTPFKLETDSLLAEYPQVVARVDSAELVLKGSIISGAKNRLFKDLRSKYYGTITDSLSVE